MPAWRRARASSVEMVLFPTPPFPERTRMMCRTPARFPGSSQKDNRGGGQGSPSYQPPSMFIHCGITRYSYIPDPETRAVLRPAPSPRHEQTRPCERASSRPQTQPTSSSKMAAPTLSGVGLVGQEMPQTAPLASMHTCELMCTCELMRTRPIQAKDSQLIPREMGGD